MKTNRKGFTITELVIVIVVIAILAAVLIPTFASLIKKANVSADTQLAKNLNTALTMYEAEGHKVDDFGDALIALTEGGYTLAKLNPTAEGHYFAWESESNQILLVDGEKDYKVVYKSKDLKNDTIGKTWWFAVSNAPEEVLAYLEEKANIVNAPKNAEALKDALEEAFTAGGEQTIYISAGVDLKENITLNNANADITLDLTNSELGAEAIFGSAAIAVKQGKLTIKNGVVGATGNIFDADGEPTDLAVKTERGTYTKIEGTTFNINTTNNGYLSFYGSADVVGATINSTDMGIGAYGGSTVTVEDTTINATGHGCFFVSNSTAAAGESSKLIVKSGNFHGGNVNRSDYKAACVIAYAGNLIIEGGNFTSNTDDMFYAFSGGTITIKGGTFDGVAFTDLTVTKLQEMVADNAGTVTEANGVFTISK